VSWWSAFGSNKFNGQQHALAVINNTKKEQQVLSRSHYVMLDFAARYSLFATSRHMIKAGVGVSVTRGDNEYFTGHGVLLFAGPGPINNDMFFKKNVGVYAGIISSLSYDYRIQQGRVLIGADVKAREYFGLPSVQVDYGVHIGYGFGGKR
jgi:hypothetical protein